MNKIILTAAIAILISPYSYATCSIEEASTCSIAKIQQPKPMQRTYSPAASINEYSETPETRLKPTLNDRPHQHLRDFGPQSTDYSYNTSCQFGVCNPSGAPQLFENRNK